MIKIHLTAVENESAMYVAFAENPIGDEFRELSFGKWESIVPDEAEREDITVILDEVEDLAVQYGFEFMHDVIRGA